MKLPEPCGPVSRRVVETVLGHRSSHVLAHGEGQVLTDRDAQLALWILYELSYRGFSGVDARLEWDLELIELRVTLEDRFEGELRSATRARVAREVQHGEDVGDLLLRMADEEGPRLGAHLRREATEEQMLDFLRERSVQQLKESDPQAFLVPRLHGAAKVAMMEVQYDEFGSGRAEGLHQELYARTLAAVGLDPTYGAYVGDVSAISLAAANMMSLFSFNRRLVAAGVGHFAVLEATSSVPSRRIAAGLKRLGLSSAAPYFDEHVEADAVHEQIVARDVCGGLVAEDPALLTEVVFGAASLLYVDRLFGEELLGRWGSLEGAAEARQEVAS
jgi:hypothetical protein